MTSGRMTPLAELFRQGALGAVLLVLLKLHQTLMHQVQGVVNELGSLFGGHGGTGQCRSCTDGARADLSRETPRRAVWADENDGEG